MINPLGLFYGAKNTMKTVAIIPAAGSGVRMGTVKAKQFLELNDRPLLALTLDRFQQCAVIDAVILVVPLMDVEYCRTSIVDKFGLTKVVKIVPGGERRQDSVRLGIEATGGIYGLVMVHDGVRPFVDSDLIERALDACHENRAVITALPANDTVKEVDRDGFVKKTYNRQYVWLVQTPQVFRYEDLISAHKEALSRGWKEVTDDALLMEKMGIPVKVILGSEKNIKITSPADLEQARCCIGALSNPDF